MKIVQNENIIELQEFLENCNEKVLIVNSQLMIALNKINGFKNYIRMDKTLEYEIPKLENNEKVFVIGNFNDIVIFNNSNLNWYNNTVKNVKNEVLKEFKNIQI